VKDDWDGKTKDENTWNPHWKCHCHGDPKFFFGYEEENKEDTVQSCFAGTLTKHNGTMKQSQRRKEATENCQFRNETQKGWKSLSNILFEIGVGAQTNSL
jgi:hypothetical protein